MNEQTKRKKLKLVITRTSGGHDEKPCKEAVKITVPHWHTRTCTESYFDSHFSESEGLWRSKGKNHKKIPSHGGLSKENWIMRQEEDKEVWGINIKSLDELFKFIDKYGEIVMGKYQYSNDDLVYELEIYDGYRE